MQLITTNVVWGCSDRNNLATIQWFAMHVAVSSLFGMMLQQQNRWLLKSFSSQVASLPGCTFSSSPFATCSSQKLQLNLLWPQHRPTNEWFCIQTTITVAQKSNQPNDSTLNTPWCAQQTLLLIIMVLKARFKIHALLARVSGKACQSPIDSYRYVPCCLCGYSYG